jgi:hypothetical protein
MDANNLSEIIKKLESIYEDLTETTARAKTVYNLVKERDFYTYRWKLKKSVRPVLGLTRISMEELFEAWVPKWKSEGRLSANGLRIRVGKEEAELLGIEEDTCIHIYDFAAKCSELYEPEN